MKSRGYLVGLAVGSAMLPILAGGPLWAADRQQEALELASRIVKSNCPMPSDESSSSGYEAQVSANFDISKLVNDLAKLSLGGRGGFNARHSYGVLQDQLTQARANAYHCREITMSIISNTYLQHIDPDHPAGNHSQAGRSIAAEHDGGYADYKGDMSPDDVIYTPSLDDYEAAAKEFIQSDGTYELAANLNCHVSTALTLEHCVVVSEHPKGFGAKVTRLVQQIILRYADKNGRPWAGRTVHVPVTLSGWDPSASNEEATATPPPPPPPSPIPSGR